MRRKLLLALLAVLMALNVDLRVLTQSALGNETISLASNFDPKAIILWTSGHTASGSAINAQFGIGFGTYRGSTVAHRCASVDAREASASGNTCREIADDALLLLHTAGAPGTRDLEVDLVSMSTGATSNVIINWANLHGTASIKVNSLILGGADLTDALAMDFTTIATPATQDVTVVSGFGQPDFLMMLAASQTTPDSITAGAGISIGFGKKGEAGRSMTYTSRDGNTTMFVSMSQRSDLIIRDLDTVSGGTIFCSFALNTNPATNWPTDGFQIDYTDQLSVGGAVAVLALKGTFTSTTGSGAAPISGGLPVVQNLDHGSVPKLGVVMGWDLVAATTVQTAGADLGAFFVGAGDGTVECLAGLSDDDGIGTSVCDKFWTDTKVVQNYIINAALQSEADGAISGNNFQLSWNDIDTVAREYQWLTLGDAAAAAENLPPWNRRKVGEAATELRGSYA